MTRLLLFGSEFEMLSSFNAQLLLRLALLAFHTKHNLSCCLGFLVEDWLSLTAKAHLFRVVTTLSLRKVGSLTSLVLGHFVNLVLSAILAGTICSAFLWNIHHFSNENW